MTLEQQLPGPIPDLSSRGQDEITWLPGLHEALPPEAIRKHLFVSVDTGPYHAAGGFAF